MPRYFFHSANGGPTPDRDGVEYADNEGAQVAALRFLSELLKDDADSFWESRSLELTVSDDQGLSLFVLRVSVTGSTALSRRPRARHRRH